MPLRLWPMILFSATYALGARPQEAEIPKALSQGSWSKHWSVNKQVTKKIKQGDILARIIARNSPGNKQTIRYAIVGLHPKSCAKALRKLSLYEQLGSYLELVQSSTFDEKQKRLTVVIDHFMLPNAMVLLFQIDRIVAPGDYPFFFPKGLFPGMNGIIRVRSVGEQCLFYADANWSGKHSGLPSVAIRSFAPYLSQLAMRKLFRLSRF